MKLQQLAEEKVGFLIVFTFLVISVGLLIEVVPLFFTKSVTEPAPGVKPYNALQVAGRDIYVREGCYNCHSQMIRPFRDEDLRYGHYSLAAESKYDHPFQWGSKRTGPDLARVGKKYSNEWHVQHLKAPRSVVPESIMPNYPWLLESELDYSDLKDRMVALKRVGVPYSQTKVEYEANVKKFGEETAKKLDINNAENVMLDQAKQGNYDGNPDKLTEMDALVAYLQVLGTMVDFSKFDEDHFIQFR